MFSRYLNADIKLSESSATGNGGKKIPIVYHSELESFINNDMRGKIQYDFPTVIPGPDAVVSCAMWDGRGKVVAIGEATQKTLTSSVAENFPVTTAANRAFDRAAIRFLGLGHVYSDQELAPDGPKNYEQERMTDGAPVTPATPAAPAMQEKPPVQQAAKSATPVQKPVTVAPQSPVPAQKPVTPAPQTAQTQNSAASNNDGEVIITMGRKYSAKPTTIADIYKENPGYLKYLVDNIQPKKTEFVQQLEAIKRFLAVNPIPQGGA